MKFFGLLLAFGLVISSKPNFAVADAGGAHQKVTLVNVSCSVPEGGGVCTTADSAATFKKFYINYAGSSGYEYAVTVADDCSSYKFNRVGNSDLFVNEPNAAQNPGFDAFSYLFDQPGTTIVYKAQANGGLVPIKYSCVTN